MMEQALYNGALSGLSLDGEHFFYDNPLASRGEHRRWTWHRCPCCPPNIGRLVASLGSICLFDGARRSWRFISTSQATRGLDGRRRDVTLRQTTQYPWDGAIELAVDPETPAEFALRLRVPGWCRSAHLESTARSRHQGTDGSRLCACPPALAEGRRGRAHLDMPAERIYAHPEVHADQGRVALKRGPIVYCLEGADNDAPPHRIALPRSSPSTSHFEPDLLAGVGDADAEAVAAEPGGRRALSHRSAGTSRRRSSAIPYSFWSNREPGK